MTSPAPENFYQQLLHICHFLESNRIPYMIVGGIAVSIWTAPRATVDLDFVIGLNEETLPSFIKSAAEAGLVVFDPKPMEFKKVKLLRMFLKGTESQLLMLDFILADDEYKRESLKRAVVLKWEEQEIKVASPEDVILLKLLSGRGQDRVDVENIIQMQKTSLDRTYLQRWAKRLSLSESLTQFLGK
ncbi:MAG TPA: nucleotidyl transferase AbiEii/AbiGii toxin family protein [Nitrospiria bacterium]|nr:nucleotidyl transferase AbiEii/AbiGii toxin family protein [Nitrospiria bacterium]